jgi:hypothetical protein
MTPRLERKYVIVCVMCDKRHECWNGETLCCSPKCMNAYVRLRKRFKKMCKCNQCFKDKGVKKIRRYGQPDDY